MEAKIGTTVKEIQLIKDNATSAMNEVEKIDQELKEIEQTQSVKKKELDSSKSQLLELENKKEDQEDMSVQESELAKNMSQAISKCEEAKATLSAQVDVHIITTNCNVFCTFINSHMHSFMLLFQ